MYPTSSNSNIGTLLRMIQEDQNQSLPQINPANAPSSAIRETVQGPIMAPNDPGSSRVVSIRPEGVTQQGPQAGGVVGPMGASPVVTPGALPVVGPKAPVAPTPGISAPQGGSSPSSSNPSAQPSAPNIGTRIMASAPAPTKSIGTGASTYSPAKPNMNVYGPSSSYSPQYFTPQRIQSSPVTNNQPKATPTPIQGTIQQIQKILNSLGPSRWVNPGYRA